MKLAADAAMIVLFDIDPQHKKEHDHWHTHEHLIERLQIPGFLRGSRWTSSNDDSRYLVIYEVSDLGVLNSDAYLRRLNNPTPWTSKVMSYYRNVQRGLCTRTCNTGHGMGGHAHLIRYHVAPENLQELNHWLSVANLADLAASPGLGSLGLFHTALKAEVTAEHHIRGLDTSLDHVLLATGYDAAAMADRLNNTLNAAAFNQHGCDSHDVTSFRLSYALAADEV